MQFEGYSKTVCNCKTINLQCSDKPWPFHHHTTSNLLSKVTSFFKYCIFFECYKQPLVLVDGELALNKWDLLFMTQSALTYHVAETSRDQPWLSHLLKTQMKVLKQVAVAGMNWLELLLPSQIPRPGVSVNRYAVSTVDRTRAQSGAGQSPRCKYDLAHSRGWSPTTGLLMGINNQQESNTKESKWVHLMGH